MNLNAQALAAALRNNGYKYLYHANSVKTVCSFLSQGALLSRGAVERLNLTQSSQESDSDDRRFDIWDDLFVDVHDLHNHPKLTRRNKYGPVLLKFDLAVLDGLSEPVWVTKKNPFPHWKRISALQDRCCTSVEEAMAYYRSGVPWDHMIIIKKHDAGLPLDFLNEIIVDDPKRSIGDQDVYDLALSAIQKSMPPNLAGKIKITKRRCGPCSCANEYNELPADQVVKFFMP